MALKTFVLGACCSVALAACTGTADPGTPQIRPTATITLTDDGSGNLQSCDANGVCESHPNPDGCATLVVNIDEQTGDTCERCADANGGAIYERCNDTAVACTVVTLPEPDCVICAYVDGAIIYSTCVAQDPQTCETGVLESGAPCRVCYDTNGRTILDECGGNCVNVACPTVACADGYQMVARPGQCCGTCEPIDQCAGVVCATEMAPPACPDGTRLARDPRDCCGWWCEPTVCPSQAATGPNGIAAPVPVDCPPGYERHDEFPLCGRCIPVVDPTRYCQSALDCNDGEICTIGAECRVMDACGCVESCDANSSTCTTTCTTCACYGVCRPSEWNCPEFSPPSPDACQDGRWESPGYDQYGCMLPPVCVCLDGAVAMDGACTDRCELVDCMPMQRDCPAGEHPEYGFPYCCGACVPDGECWTFADPCWMVPCAAGTRCEAQPDCTTACVEDIASCFSSADCAPGNQCTTELGDCLPPPGCDPARGMMCPAVCTGVCKPVVCSFDADCAPGSHCEGSSVCPPDVTCIWQGAPGICVADTRPTCTSSQQCGANERCTTEDGSCRPAPACDSTAVACTDVCYGECVPKECVVTECGPALGMANYLCADGRTVAGPTGRCLKNDAGTCGWEILSCP
jgi:hypothetical protein